MKGILSVVLLVFLFSLSFSGFQIYVAQGSEVHDVAISSVTAWPVFLPPSVIYINVTVENQGTSSESFNLTVYAENLTIQTKSVVDLGPSASETRTFEGDISSPPFRAMIFPPPWPPDEPMVENVTIWAEASVVAGEIDTSDNVYIDGIVTIIWCPPDIDGDGDIDIFDIVFVAGRYGSESGDPGYDPFADLDQDGDVDIFDIVIMANPGVYGVHYV